jgi:hypothetical protein
MHTAYGGAVEIRSWRRHSTTSPRPKRSVRPCGEAKEEIAQGEVMSSEEAKRRLLE